LHLWVLISRAYSSPSSPAYTPCQPSRRPILSRRSTIVHLWRLPSPSPPSPFCHLCPARQVKVKPDPLRHAGIREVGEDEQPLFLCKQCLKIPLYFRDQAESERHATSEKHLSLGPVSSSQHARPHYITALSYPCPLFVLLFPISFAARHLVPSSSVPTPHLLICRLQHPFICRDILICPPSLLVSPSHPHFLSRLQHSQPRHHFAICFWLG